MPKGQYVDHMALHRALWERADRLGRVRFKQGDLANELGITKFTMSRVIRSFIATERLTLLSSNKNMRGQFHVADPEQWLKMFGEDDED